MGVSSDSIQPRESRLRAFERVPVSVDPPTALRAARALGGPAMLDSVGGTPRRFSLVAFDPLERCEQMGDPGDLASALGRLPALPHDGPFAGGFVGALAYDLGMAGESLSLPPARWPTPALAGGLYTDHLWFDHERGSAELVLAELEHDPRGALPDRLARANAALAQARDAAAVPAEGAARAVGELARNASDDEHAQRIESLRERIRLGDVYQANLAHRIEVSLEGDPLDLYLALRAANPAPYAGYLEFREACGRQRALLSSSPELLLEVSDGVARTRPIKGTAPRGASPEQDAAIRAGLLASVKDRAELAMIVDLARNDLGRLARPGGVSVGCFSEVETYAAVHHLVADVRAELSAGVEPLDVLRSAFPAASITGAPKAAAMEAIAALEGEGRGFFSGSLGFIDRRGRSVFDVLIRTLEWRAGHDSGPGRVSLWVGGGITWDSVARLEVEETHHKARALLWAMGLEA
jgi:para-aminobenzoate synthetase component 1